MQEIIQPLATVVVSVVIPLIVNLVKTHGTSSNAARWISLIASVLGGVIVALASGIPTDPSEWVVAVFTVIGGVQLVYSVFKSAGVTNTMLDALLDIDVPARVKGRASVTAGMPKDNDKE